MYAFNATCHLVEMVVSLAPFRVARRLVLGQHVQDFVCDKQGVFHLVFGCAGMDVLALDFNVAVAGVERLVFHFAKRPAVDSIGKIRAKVRDIELVRAAADFFIGCKADFHRTVRDRRVVKQLFRQRQDFSDAAFVVRAHQRRAVGDQQVAADVSLQFREFGGR